MTAERTYLYPEPNLSIALQERAVEAPLQLPKVIEAHDTTVLMESLFRVLIHNDDVTPFDYVMAILGKVFLLSEEIAEHVAMTAHTEGLSIVIIRPRSEAERLSLIANRAARADGYPLTFTVETDY